jgi:hypothetical protein
MEKAQDEKEQEKQFQQVVKRLLDTPPQHRPSPPKKPATKKPKSKTG